MFKVYTYHVLCHRSMYVIYIYIYIYIHTQRGIACIICITCMMPPYTYATDIIHATDMPYVMDLTL